MGCDMGYFLAIDIGASSGRHIVGRLEGGLLKTEEVYRFPNGAVRREDGRLVWDADRLFEEILRGLKQAKRAGRTPSFVGIDTWAVDYALLDGADRRVGDVYCYRDGRTGKVIPAVHEKVPFETLYERTGIQFQPFNTLYQLCADAEEGRLGRAKSMLMLPDYLGFLLTGEKRQEYTNATSTGLVNAATHRWDGEIIEKLSLPASLFGPLSQPGSAVGKFRPEVERELGYSATVLLPATHDTASAVLAAPLGEGDAYISSGTWSLLGREQERAHTDENSLRSNYSNEGSVNFGFRYQKNIMGLWMIQSVKRELKDRYTFARLSEMAASRPSRHRVDVNDGRFLSPESMTEEVRRAVEEELPVPDLMRTIYDSLAESYGRAIGELERNAGRGSEKLHIFGGGCRDGFLNRLTAEATGKKVVTGPVEATAIGNLIMQMIGAGELGSLSEARSVVKKSFEIKEI